MNFQIKIIALDSEIVPNKNGGYTKLSVTFENLSSKKTDGKKIMSFASPKAFEVLSKATKGDVFTVTSTKNEKTNFWDWVDVTPGVVENNSTTASTGAIKTPKSTYETPEERAKKQIYIVRQSSLSNAIETLKTEKNTPASEDVLKLAQVYYDWVMENGAASSGTPFDDMVDDIPL